MTTKSFTYFERFVRIFSSTAAELLFYKRQYELLEKILMVVVPQTSLMTREAILQLKGENHVLTVELEKMRAKYQALETRNIELTKQLAQQYRESRAGNEE